MNDELKDQQGIPEALANEPTREMLAKARTQPCANLAKKLKVSKPPVFLPGFGENETRKKAKKNAGDNAKSKGKMRRAA